MPPTLPPRRVRATLRRLGLSARHRLGQHFLVDGRALGSIVAAAELSTADIVIEVGPGLGVMTRELAGRAGRVIGVELDAALAEHLVSEFAATPTVAIVGGDILQWPPERLLALVGADGRSYKVVANLPYNVAAAVVRHFLEAAIQPTRMVVMVQREVAERMVAAPGKMSLLSVAVQFYARARIVTRLSPRSFYPQPRVASAVVRLDIGAPPPYADAAAYFAVVKAGFSAPRKQLRNALAHALAMPPLAVEAALATAGIEPSRRAQTLALDEWARLAATLTQSRVEAT